MQWYKKVVLSVAAFSSVLTLGAGSAHALTSYGADPAEDLAMLIAARFNLNPDDVHRVIDEHHAAMQEMAYGNRDWGTWLYDGENPVGDNIEDFDRYVPYSSSPDGGWNMDQAVYDGLTQEQRDLIRAKQSQVDDYLSGWSGMSADTRQSAVQRLMDAVNTWADENDIPRGYIDFGIQNVNVDDGARDYGFMPYSLTGLNLLVNEGNLTRDQRDLIVSKQSEIQSFLDSLAGRTAEGRRLSLRQFRQQLNQWASDNNIPSRYVAAWLNLGLIQLDSNGLPSTTSTNQGTTSTGSTNTQSGNGTSTNGNAATVNNIQNGVVDNTNHPTVSNNNGTIGTGGTSTSMTTTGTTNTSATNTATGSSGTVTSNTNSGTSTASTSTTSNSAI